jgi:hypothetical protein
MAGIIAMYIAWGVVVVVVVVVGGGGGVKEGKVGRACIETY